MNQEDLKQELSLEEKERRWSLLRERMTQEGLGAIIVYGIADYKREVPCRYLTNMAISQGCEHVLLFPINEAPILLVTYHEPSSLAKTLSWVPTENIHFSAHWGVDLAKHLSALKLQNERVGIDSRGMLPVQEYLAYKELCPDIEPVEVTG